MRRKLDLHHHRALLSVTLLVLLVIAIIFGGYLATASSEVPVLGVMTFSIAILILTLMLLQISIIIRTRDELHGMHEENRQHFHSVHERIKTVHSALTEKKTRRR